MSTVEEAAVLRVASETPGKLAAPLEHLYGILRMLHSMMQVSEGRSSAFAPLITPAVVYCTVAAGQIVNENSQSSETVELGSSQSMARNVRKLGLQCLEMLFRHGRGISWDPHLTILFQTVISPRLSKFAVETAQGVSWLLQIFATWSKSPDMIPYLVEYDKRLLGAVWGCLSGQSVQHNVKALVLKEIVQPLASIASEESETHQHVRSILESQIGDLLSHLTVLLESNPPRDLLQHALEALTIITPLARSGTDVQKVAQVLINVLKDLLEPLARSRGVFCSNHCLVSSITMRTTWIRIFERDCGIPRQNSSIISKMHRTDSFAGDSSNVWRKEPRIFTM